MRHMIFDLFEEQVTALTPTIAVQLTEASRTYPEDWIAEAFAIAWEQGEDNWPFIRKTLEDFRRPKPIEPVKPGACSQPPADRRAYISGPLGRFIKH